VALARPGIRDALGKFGTAYRHARAEALSLLDYPASRRKLKIAKEAAIENLPALAEQFILEARSAGAFVYEASTAEDANSYILKLARKRGVTLAVKVKSMVSEEIELNHYLERHGITALEADCGEWIIQQAGEKPSHSVMPAIHLSREEVAQIYSKAFDREIEPDIPLMVTTLRNELRDKFVNAGMGMWSKKRWINSSTLSGKALNQVIQQCLGLGINPVKILEYQAKGLHLAFAEQEVLNGIQGLLATLWRIEGLPLRVQAGDVQKREECWQCGLQRRVQCQQFSSHLLSNFSMIVPVLNFEVSFQQIDNGKIGGGLAVRG
jgi:hypothetical protein